MADPDRARSKRTVTRLKRPYLSEWIIAQPSPRKEVLLQVFSGTPERECARKLNMSTDEVAAIARKAAEECPKVMEDEYAMACFSAKSAEEFDRITHQGAGIYKFLSLRYHKSEPKAPARQASATHVQQPASRHSNAAAMDSWMPVSTDQRASSQPTGASHKSRKRTTTAHAKASSPTAKGDEAPSIQSEQAAPAPEVHPRADDPEAQRRREARRLAREQDRVRRLSGDW